MPLYRSEDKPCIKCGGERKRSPAGLVYCVDCNRRYREENRERNRKRDMEYHFRNRDVTTARMRSYNAGERTPRKPGKPINEAAREWRRKGNEGSRHPDYGVWSKIKSRTSNPDDPDFINYGGRPHGNPITMCDRWKASFYDFLEDMGPRPEPRHLYSIERIDVNGNYEPPNCKWGTRLEQNNNTRRNTSYRMGLSEDNILVHEGREMTLREFSDITGIHINVVKYRWAQHPQSTDWILADDYDVRLFPYRGQMYNMPELKLISGLSIPILRGRILVCGWTPEKAIHTPVIKRKKRE